MRVAVVALLLLASQLSAADKRPMTLDDFFAVKRVANPQISPDGKHVVYQVTEVNLKENKTATALWVTTTDGKGTPKKLADGKGPRWSPDGKWILFASGSRLYVTDITGKDTLVQTQTHGGASNGIWSPDGKHIAFVVSVYPEFSEKPFIDSNRANRDKDDEIAKNPVKAKTFTKLFYRHWNEYVGDKRQHIFVVPLELNPEKVLLTDPRDVTPGDRDAFPTSSTFDSGDNFTFTPDSKHIVFTAPPAENEAWSTNYDLCRVSITNTSTKWETLTTDNKAADSGPRFSPDGKKLAWRAQKKVGYEADKWDVLIRDAKPDGSPIGAPTGIVAGWDVSINEFAWFGEGVLFVTDTKGRQLTYEWRPKDGIIAAPFAPVPGASSLTSGDGLVAYLSARMHHSAEVFVGESNLSRANEALLGELALTRPESVEVPVEGTKMHMWVQKPPGFDPKKKWPVVYLVHGGPQSAWRDVWNYRWNAQLWAAQGYVVVMPNPRGSVGFGQKFTDEITGDWGGKCYRDLVAGLEYVEKLPYVDKDRIAAAGGSFGGYMMNWFAVNDIAPRFKCLITHCSVWNFESMWGTTDELWFDEYEHGGLPWEQPKKYAQFSPHKRAGELKKHKTPMLILHNDLDFRCPIGQGHELFTALQRNGVPSRFVNFPDEGHHVLKPKNSEHWHKEVFAWLKKYAPPGGM
ncbi:MAG: S9 family peptidase [Planctomycetes bacterium]|nr:S9 family peptidase [Planctomycetota bacterium]